MSYEYGLRDADGNVPRAAMGDIPAKIEELFYKYLEARIWDRAMVEGPDSLEGDFDDDRAYAMWDKWIEESLSFFAPPANLRDKRAELVNRAAELV